ncbi:hypothetical protein TNCV_5101181 [Trichonephila clavipes]|nr:hypothetical protein TNCV_5101181 [Trichonephila clavipes]
MDVCKCIVPSRHGGTWNSRRTASPLVILVEWEESLNMLSDSGAPWTKLDTGVRPRRLLSQVLFYVQHHDGRIRVWWYRRERTRPTNIRYRHTDRVLVSYCGKASGLYISRETRSRLHAVPIVSFSRMWVWWPQYPSGQGHGLMVGMS